MAAYTRKQYSGAARNTTTTTLLTNVGTTVDIAATTGWPSIAGIPFYVVIQPSSIYEEKCLATISGSTLTLTRAQDDTTASQHPIGSTIYPVFTANDADEANELVSKLTTAGDLLTTDGTNLLRLGVGPNGYFLKASSSASAGIEWASIPTINSLDDIGDVTITSVEDGDFLVYSNSASAWVNDTIHFITVSDTAPNDEVAEGDLWYNSLELELYTYYSGSWVQVTFADPGVPELYELTDVIITDPVNGQTIVYNGTEWENAISPSALSLETARTISLSGDVTGSVSFDGSQNVDIPTVIQINSITLGVDTSGNYVSDVAAGTGVTVTHTPGEGSTPTIAIGQAVGTSASVSFAHVSADLTGDVTGNADTATALETARIISLGGDLSGSVSFNGTSNVTISAAIQPDSVALGTDTTGNYMSDLTQGTGVTITHTPSEGSNATIAIGQDVSTSASVAFANVTADLVGDVTGNADTATALETARTVELSGDVSGSASFDGTSNINIFTTVNTASVAIGELFGVNITDPLEFQTLEYNGTEWVNQYASVVSYVRNVEATTITTGTPVYLFGGTGDHATVKRADNSTDATSSKTVGLAGANIAASQNGPVITRGYVDGVNLSMYNPGDVLWLGKNGQFTTTKPSAPDHLVFIGVVVRATNNGIVYVATQNGYELEELHDVKISGVTDGQFLRYNSASTAWVNDTINLGTDTAGDYVQNLTAGTGVTLSNNSGEGATPTVSIGQSVATSASVTFAHLIVQGDMEVQGTITRLNETNLDVESAFIYLNATSASANPDMGVAFNYDDGTYRHAGLFRDSSDGIFKVFEGYEPEPVSPINTSDATYSDARFQAESLILTQTTGIAPMSVSSSTVVTNLNADKLDGQDGSYYAPINSPTFTGTVSLPNNTVALGTQTTGNYVADLSGGVGVTVTHTQGEGTTPSVAIGQDVATSASVTFATVTAPLIGNASTATTLQTARTISLSGDVTGSVSFNGSSNVDIAATIAANSVALGTDTTGNYMSGVSAGTGISISHTPGEGSTATISTTGVQTLGAKAGNYTLAAGDAAETIIIMDSSSANDLTVPSASVVAFGTGTSITVVQRGTGKTRILAGAGVTLLATPGLFLRAQYSSCTLVKTENANEWFVIGDLAAS